MYDLIIRNGVVIDGTGRPRKNADIAIRDGLICKVALNIVDESKNIFNANRFIIAPGFIDSHTHDDRLLLSHPEMTPKVSQGVTTVVGGNCGVSLAPLKNIEPPLPMNLLGGQDWYRFETVKEYREELETARTATNCAMLVGHSTLRAGVMDRLDRAANSFEIDSMKQGLSDAMESGCIGLSTGLAYPTAIEAPTQEVIDLATELSDLGGIYATHMRDESEFLVEAVEESITIAQQANVPMVISHHKSSGKTYWGKTKETLKLVNQARKEQVIHFDVYPYIASSSVLLESFILQGTKVLITWSAPFPECGGQYLNVICDKWGCDIASAVKKLNPAGAIYFEIDEYEMRSLLQQPGAMIGSDGLPHDPFPHPRLWGTFSRVVGYYARELGLFTMEEAIHKMTGLTASVFGLKNRGLVKQGYFADLVVFDENEIIDLADYEQPELPSAGIDRVYVNGEVVWKQGSATGKRPGKWLERVIT